MIGSPFPIYWGDVEVFRKRITTLTEEEDYAGLLEPYIFKYERGYLVSGPPKWAELKLESTEVYWIKTTRDKVKLRFQGQDLQQINCDNSAHAAGDLWADVEDVGGPVPPDPPY